MLSASKPNTVKTTSEVSHRGDKVDAQSKHGSPRLTEAEEVELAIWAKEKESLDMFAVFYAEKIEPFTGQLMAQLKEDPEMLTDISH